MRTPEMEAPGTVAADVRAQREDQRADSATTCLDKLQATTAAEFARQGFGLLQLADGSFLATRWSCCRPLADLKAARAFLKLIGGAV